MSTPRKPTPAKMPHNASGSKSAVLRRSTPQKTKLKPVNGVRRAPKVGTAPRKGPRGPVKAAAVPSKGMVPWSVRSSIGAWQHDPGWVYEPVDPAIARQILRAATTGDLLAQWELFSLMEDSWERLSKNLNEVKNSVRRLPWCVTAFGERDEPPTPEAEERADLVDRCLRTWLPRAGTMERSFEDTIYDLLDAFSKGISVVELHWRATAMEWRPRASHAVTPRQYGWNPERTELGLIVGSVGAVDPMVYRGVATQLNPRSASWAPFPENQFLIGQWGVRTGAPGATAMLRSLVPYWLGAVYGWRWLLETAEMFGVPFRWGTYDPDQPDVGTRLAEMLENLGSAGWAAFPNGTTIDFREAMANAEGNPQAVILALAKQACDIVVLGQDSSTEAKTTGLGDGTSKLQSRVRDEVLKHASWWVADVINYQLIPAILTLNYGDAEFAPTVRPDLSTDPDPLALAQRDAILKGQLGMQLPMEWLCERHQVPSVAPTGDQPAAGSNQAEPGTNTPKPGDGEDAAQTGSTAADPEEDAPEVNAASGADPGAESDHQVLPAVVEEIVTAAVAESVGARRRWLEPVREELDALIARAQSGQITDADLTTFAEAAARSMPDLFARMDVNALADSLTAAMGTAAVAGATKG